MRMQWFFIFFFFSGFCSLLYEVIWVRLGMAHFGVTTPIISLFLSLFMAGLGLGSWLAGSWMRNIENHTRSYPLRLYALTELLIGASAWTVPLEMEWARNYLENYGSDLAVSSLHYYWIAGLWLTLILLPWCTCMGATFPLAMAAIRKVSSASQRSFSFLYLANVLGAVVGSLLPAFVLVEIFGFRGTLKLAAVCNLLIAAVAFLLSLRAKHVDQKSEVKAETPQAVVVRSADLTLGLVFLTGLVCLAMEVIWIRQFTPYIGTEVYAFAWILGCYLMGTLIGSRIYRRWLRRHTPGEETVAWFFLGLAGLLPLLGADPRLSRFHMMGILRVALGIMPITGLMGFVTPLLVDQYSEGNPDRAGKAYAVNVVGCILGPLLAGFLLLPNVGEHWSLVLLSLPLFSLLYVFRPKTPELRRRYGLRFHAEAALVALALIVFTKDYFTRFAHPQVRRDYTATVTAVGDGMERQLFVNGVGITSLTPITKMMAHLPLAFLGRQPQNALVVCFGMGTTYRSMLSWGIPSTAVELVPSVPSLFYYFHSDGPRLLQSPLSHVVIDDGRLYLERSKEQYDVVTIDPPPPVEAAGSSLLYSKDFYEIVKRKLRPGGILQQWLPKGDSALRASVARAVKESFPYVRVFSSVEGTGLHFLASTAPIISTAASELALRLPERASSDLIEWGPASTPEQQFTIVLRSEIPVDQIIREDPKIPPLQDDRPINEYFLLRRMRDHAYIERLWRRFLTEELSPPLGVRELLAYSVVRRSS